MKAPGYKLIEHAIDLSTAPGIAVPPPLKLSDKKTPEPPKSDAGNIRK
jgi:hypothetical protein